MDDASPPSDARGAPSFGDEGLLRLTGDPFFRGETHGRRVDNLLSMVWRPQQGIAQFVLTRGGTKDSGGFEECREIHVRALLDSSPRESLLGVRP